MNPSHIDVFSLSPSLQVLTDRPVSDSEDKVGSKEKSVGLCSHRFGLVTNYKQINVTEDCAMRVK